LSARPKGAPSFGLFRQAPSASGLGAPLQDDAAFDETDPVFAVPRPHPQGHSSVVKPDKKGGWIFCLGADLSDRPALIDPAPRAAKIRVLTTGKAVLGEVALSSDGSFHLAVPADTPLGLEALAADGRVIRRQETWIWVRPNERRGCIGCHEDPEIAPPNRVPDAVREPPVSLLKGGGK